MKCRDDLCPVVAENRPDEFLHLCGCGQTEQRERLRFRDFGRLAVSGSEEGDHLVEQRLRVAHSAVRRACDDVNRRIGDLHAFGVCDEREAFRYEIGRNPLQVKALAAGNDGRQNLVDFGCRKDEFCMFGRFFDGFEQSVPGALGEHVDFVDDVDFVFGTDRQMQDFLADFACFFDLRVRSGVDFDHIDAAFVGDGDAGFTFAARFAVDGVETVQRFCEDTSGGCFSDSARADEEIRLGDSS